MPTELVLLDLDETLLASSLLAGARLSKHPLQLSRVHGYAELHLFDGIVDALTALSMVVRVGLVSSSGRWYVDQLLDSFLPDFDWAVKVTYDDVTAIKPSAEPLLVALQRTSIAPARALYVGDSQVDYEACVSAGVAFVGARWADFPTFPAAARSVRSPRDLLALVSGDCA